MALSISSYWSRADEACPLLLRFGCPLAYLFYYIGTRLLLMGSEFLPSTGFAAYELLSFPNLSSFA